MNKQSFITILLTVLMSMTGAKTFAHDIEAKNADNVTIYYKWTNNHTELAVSYRGSSSSSYSNEYSDNVVIPKSVTYNGNTYPVTSIGSLAFNGCKVTSVTIPNSVTSIGNYAFAGCSGLTSVTIPNSVTSIGESAFKGCSGLTSVDIIDLAVWCNIEFSEKDSNPLNYAHHLFINGNEITNLVIPNNVTAIGSYAFCGCWRLTSVTIPNSVTSIGNYAFYGCSGLTSVIIPNSVTSIGESAFSCCDGLTSVTIPNSVTSIGSSAFLYCYGLPSVTIPNSVTSIGSSVFQYCSGLTSVTIPNSVTSIGCSAFYQCSGLTSVTIPKSVTSIGESAFSSCSDLISVVVNCSPTTIGSSPFSGCTKIEEVLFDCENVTSLFKGFSYVKKVILSDNIKSIGNYAFYECSDLATIFSEIKTPFEIGSIANTSVTLVVPSGTKAAYQSTVGWSNFTNTVEVGEGGLVGCKFENDGILYPKSEIICTQIKRLA